MEDRAKSDFSFRLSDIREQIHPFSLRFETHHRVGSVILRSVWPTEFKENGALAVRTLLCESAVSSHHFILYTETKDREGLVVKRGYPKKIVFVKPLGFSASEAAVSFSGEFLAKGTMIRDHVFLGIIASTLNGKMLDECLNMEILVTDRG